MAQSFPDEATKAAAAISSIIAMRKLHDVDNSCRATGCIRIGISIATIHAKRTDLVLNIVIIYSADA